MYNNDAVEALGPLFAKQGWVFFAPYRRGQGLLATQRDRTSVTKSLRPLREVAFLLELPL